MVDRRACTESYPSKGEKHYLAHYAGMTQRQLNDWFANARRNIKKVGYETWKEKHSAYSAYFAGINPFRGPGGASASEGELQGSIGRPIILN